MSSVEICAQSLADAHRTGQRLVELPIEIRPQTLEESYAIQQKALDHLGYGAAWKVGAGTPDSTPLASPLPKGVVFPGPHSFSLKQFGFCGIEVELGFRLGKSLPPRSKPYDRDEVLDAVQLVTTTLEIVDSRFLDYKTVDRFSHLADFQNNGALVSGAPFSPWQDLNLATLHARLEIDGVKRGESIGGNTAGDPIRLLVWLANHAADRGLPLGAGDIVTSGALTGMTIVDHPAKISGFLEGIGSVELSLA